MTIRRATMKKIMTAEQLDVYARAFIGKTVYGQGGYCQRLTVAELDKLRARMRKHGSNTFCRLQGRGRTSLPIVADSSKAFKPDTEPTERLAISHPTLTSPLRKWWSR